MDFKNIKWIISKKKQKRIMVAKDVIAQIKAKKYIPNIGAYIKYINHIDGIDFLEHLDIKSNFKKIQDCSVCAIGATFMSCTKFGNKLNFNDVGGNLKHINEEKIKKLLSIFDPMQLLLIESAFEGPSSSSDRFSTKIYGLHLSEEDVKATLNFKRKYCPWNEDTWMYEDTYGKLMIAIMQNIIDNDGTFIL